LLQALAPAASENDPPGHASQVLDPVLAAKLPTVQASHDVAAVLSVAEPASHGVHVGLPADLAKLPAEQSMQAPDEAGEEVPAAQSLHDVASVREKVPAEQAEQDADASLDENEPAAHCEH